MRIIVYSNQGLSPAQFGMELELIDRLQGEGHEVFVVKCEARLSSCYFNPTHNLFGCSICSARTDIFLNYIGVDPQRLFRLKNFSEASSFAVPDFANFDELLAFEYEGVNIGRGVASSTISTFRDYNVLNQQNRRVFLEIQVRMAINVVLNFTHFFETIKPDRVYLFNGRFAESFPLVELCQRENITFFTFERGATARQFELFQNALPHSIRLRQQLMEEHWDRAQNGAREDVGRLWYEQKRAGTVVDGINFVKSLQKGALPEEIPAGKCKVAIFNSSEDEMKAIGEWENDLYQHQNDAIRALLERFRNDDSVHFFLRVHPNLTRIDNQQTRELFALDYPNLTLIRPEEKIDSYALLEACDKILTFASTIGIEATYWGKPSILYGKAFYDNLDCVYMPASMDELAELIQTEDLPPKSSENTLKYAYYLMTSGQSFQYLDYHGKQDSYYRGKPIKRVYGLTVAKLLKFLPGLAHWQRLHSILFGRSLRLSDLFKLKSHLDKEA